MVKFSQYYLYRYPIKSMHVLIFTYNYRIIGLFVHLFFTIQYEIKKKTKQNKTKKTLSRDIIEVA